ncbi:ROK family protein [Candidatus Woesearchaeota archaeon]|nr:ROK family protein [Candidatus Woesearchaeota archaeon]
MARVIGVDIGGTHISAGLVSSGKVLVEKKVLISGIKTKKEFVDSLFGIIGTLMDKKIKGIGIGFPAPIVDGCAPEVQNMPFLNKINLKGIIEKEFNARCEVSNDANLFALGEQKFGAAKGKKNVVGITLGTGLGCGIIINGEIYSGATGAAGEISRIPSRRGKLERFASARFIRRVSGKEAELLYELAKKGDKRALRKWARFGKNVGRILTIIVDTLDPEMIVLGGKIANAYPYFSKQIMPEIEKNSFKLTYSKTRIAKAKLKNSTILGAASLLI